MLNCFEIQSCTKVVNLNKLKWWNPRSALIYLVLCSLCQRLDSRQLTQITSAEGARKIEHECRRRESLPEAKGERSEPFAGGARDSAKRFG